MPSPTSTIPASLARVVPLLAAMAGIWMFASPTFAQTAAPTAPSAGELTLTTVSAWLRPALTLHLRAPMSGSFHFVAPSGQMRAGEVIGRFDDKDLQAAVDTARLRLQIARQQEADFAADQPTRLEEARRQISDLESKLILARTVANDPALLQALPAATKDALKQVDPAILEAQITAARAKLARLEAPGFADGTTARLQVMDAGQTLQEAEKRLAAAVLTAPFAGQFQPAAALGETDRELMLAGGQEIGTLRDITRVEAAVPALSPYLIRSRPQATELRFAGPGGKTYIAPFKAAVTETSPVTGEARVFIYRFSPGDAASLALLINTNIHATIVQRCEPPVTVVAKFQAALDHPEAFRAGWAGGVGKIWPGWKLVCEGETELGIAPAQP